MSDVKWAFPSVDPGQLPLGGRILVQLRRVKKTTQSGIILHNETRDFEKYNNQIAKVHSLGPLAFKKRDTMEPWPEGTWAEPGDFVRVPKYNGDKFEVTINDEPDEPVVFMYLNDHELIGKITGDPMDSTGVYVNR